MKSLIQQYFTKYNLPVATLLMLSFVIFFIYLQSSQGPMVLDDVPNITQNEKLKITQLDSQSLYQAATSMHETLGGNPLLKRPLSYMSFSLNYYFFGDATQSFKITNLALHIFNGFLLYAFLLQLIRRLNRDQIVDPLMPKWIASITACCWLLHPLMVSTVFYTVQRMTILSALFSLCALNSFMFYRGKLLETGSGFFKGMTLMILFISLAFLSKENGVLVFFFCGLIEWLLFRCQFHFNFKLSYQRLYYVLLFVPIALILLFLLRQYMLSTDAVMEFRQFNTHMRLLTESRVLFSYLSWIGFPSPTDLTFLHDDYPISHSLFNPITTLISMVSWLVIIVGVIRLGIKNKLSWLTFGIGWYFVGHILESTVINLELVFEHRNYLPSIGPIFILVWMSVLGLQKTKMSQFFKVFLMLAFFVLLPMSLTAQRLSYWKIEEQLISHWIDVSPDSIRTWSKLADYQFKHHQMTPAFEALNKGFNIAPWEAGFGLSQLVLLCQDPQLNNGFSQHEIINKTKRALNLKPNTSYTISQLNNLPRHCPTDQQRLELKEIYQTASQQYNPRISALGYYMLALIEIQQKHPKIAKEYLQEVMQRDPSSAEVKSLYEKL